VTNAKELANIMELNEELRRKPDQDLATVVETCEEMSKGDWVFSAGDLKKVEDTELQIDYD